LYGDNSAALIFYIGKPVKILVNVEDLKRYEKYDSILIIADSDAQKIATELNTLYEPIKKTTYEREPYTLYLRKRSELSSEKKILFVAEGDAIERVRGKTLASIERIHCQNEICVGANYR
jgi:hypothetical protein